MFLNSDILNEGNTTVRKNRKAIKTLHSEGKSPKCLFS